MSKDVYSDSLDSEFSFEDDGITKEVYLNERKVTDLASVLADSGIERSELPFMIQEIIYLLTAEDLCEIVSEDRLLEILELDDE